jgi:molybdopterin molybdotransferase
LSMSGIPPLISYEQALRTVLENVHPLGQTHCPLEKSLGRIVAEDIRAPMHLPEADRSGVDGYALRSVDTLYAAEDRPVRLKIVGQVVSATDRPPAITAGKAIAIMTGGAVPQGADTIVKREDVESDGHTMTLRAAIPPGRYISEKGKDLVKGALVAKKGTMLDPVAYSVLASVRMAIVPVMKRPAASILAVGSELADLSEKENEHKIVASNLFLLSALIETMGIQVALARITKDDKASLQTDLKEALKNDLLITAGGTMHSRSDLTRSAMEEAGIDLQFSGMSVVPGKGTSFGLFKGRPVFALPGTPSAVFTVFYTLISPCLRKLMGQEQTGPTTITAVLEEDLHKRPGLEHFVMGQVSVHEGGYRVRPLAKPEHPVFSAMRLANGFIVVPANRDHLKKGATVSVHLLDPLPSTESLTLSGRK